MKRRLIDNADFWFGYLVALALCLCGLFVFSVLFPSCATAGLQGKDAELVHRNARNVGRIEGTAENLGELVDRSQERLKIVSRASEKIADGVQRLEYLLDEYEREVERILAEIDRLRAQQEEMGD